MSTAARRGAGARLCRAALVALSLGVAAPVASAQGGGGGGRPPERRAQLERQFRDRLAAVVRQRLQLTDAQMSRLEQTNAHFAQRRRDLVQQERETRVAIRDEVVKDSAANQQHVADLIERAIGLQRQRLDLVDAEQKELAQFLTPVQRARYLDLQEKLRQRVEQLRRQQQSRRGADSGAGPGPRRRGRGGGAGGPPRVGP